MERLLVAIENTDGFTFSVTQHFPVVFSSKEEFLITLEDKIKEVQVTLKEQQQIHNDMDEKITKKLQKIHKTKNLSEKEGKELNAELQKMMLENGELHAEMNKMQNFTLGGQTFSLSDFISRSFDSKDTTEYLNLPQVYTIDEYFSDVEKALTPTKPKM